MAQKVNPVSVRLRFNRNSDFSWFSDYYYTSFFLQDIHLEPLFHPVKQSTQNQLNSQLARCVLHRYPKRNVIHLFALTSGNDYNFVRDIYQKQDTTRSNLSLLSNSDKVAQTKRTNEFDQKKGTFGDQSQYGSTRIVVERKNKFNYDSDVHDSFLSLMKQRVKLNELTKPCVAKQHMIFDPCVVNQREKLSEPLTPLLKSFDNDLRAQLSAVTRLNELLYISGCTNAFMTAHLQTTYQHSISGLFHDSYNTHSKLSGWYENQQQYKRTSQELLKAEINQLNVQPLNPRLSAEALVCMNYDIMSYWFHLKTNHASKALFEAKISPCSETTRKALGLKDSDAEELLFNQTADSFYATVWASGFIALKELQLQPLLSHSHHHCLKNIQSAVYKQSNTLTSLVPVKIASIYQSASLVAQDVCNKIEHKKSFRQICRLMFQQIESCKYIKGIRICCSGRFNGAEIAKTERKQYGETSLHVFSDRIDYAYAEAFTAYGTLGVKVWISYL